MRCAAALSALACLLTGTVAQAEAPQPARELRVLDFRNEPLELAGLQASLSRSLPDELGSLTGPDRDALRFLLVGPPDSSLEAL